MCLCLWRLAFFIVGALGWMCTCARRSALCANAIWFVFDLIGPEILIDVVQTYVLEYTRSVGVLCVALCGLI